MATVTKNASARKSGSKKNGPKMTPMMQRYMEVKQQNPGTMLLFRMGDFYELFHDDAKAAAKLLGITLTSRDKGSDNPIPMAGFPHHALENYLAKLIRSGLRVSICDQVEDPKEAKGMVRREVTRIVTPGTLTDDGLLDPKENNFLACLFPAKSAIGLAWLDVSTGRFTTAEVAPEAIADELARIHPAECLLPEQSPLRNELQHLSGILWSERPAWDFNAESNRKRLLTHFGTRTLEGFDLDDHSVSISAAGALLGYVEETQKASLGHITKLSPHRSGAALALDEATRRSLELTRTMREGKRENSLIDVIDETVTPMGARLLAEWLSNPLTDKDRIDRRLEAVAELHGQTILRGELRDQLDNAYDLHRLVARVATGRCSPRDLCALGSTLGLLPKLKAKLSARKSSLLGTLEESLDLCPEVRTAIEEALDDDPPIVITEGGVIKPGHNSRLDELRELARGGKAWIAKYQAGEVERTGIPSMKIGFNKVFGYFLEVTAVHRERVPDDYKRVQTLKNAERFTTPELKEYEEKVRTAEDEANTLEQELFQQLRDRIAEHVARLQQTADVLATVDVLAGLATLASRQNYCRPEIVTEPVLDIRDGRHPVLDRLQPTGAFVPNDVRLGIPNETEEASAPANAPFVQIITGPNMAGKSTYIRQAALLTLMAQMGSFIPASSATVGIADRIFARVGASDELGKGQSTFMVEMTETARILNAATKHSLVILDEIGRGTSTYDGISLAKAVSEHLHDVIGCRTLFATHYHELTDLEAEREGVTNWNVAVRETGETIVFLHKILPGTADKSYGIHVARLAGVPTPVVRRADELLAGFEAEALPTTSNDGPVTITDAAPEPAPEPQPTAKKAPGQLSLFADDHPVLDELRTLDLETMSEAEALRLLKQLRKSAGS